MTAVTHSQTSPTDHNRSLTMSTTGLMIKDAAKQLQIGSKTLFDLLHQKGLTAPGTNFPSESAVRAGYFKTEPRSCTIKGPGESTGRSKVYHVTLITDAGMKFLQPIVAEYKAAAAPAPGRMKLTLELWTPEVVHALVRYATLARKLESKSMTPEEHDEYHRARRCLSANLPILATTSLERLNKKLFAHPKFQIPFQPQQARQ